MGGIELRDGTLVVDREPNDLDELAIRFSAILDDLVVDHVFVSGGPPLRDVRGNP